MKITIDSNYCVISIECAEEEERCDTKMIIDIRNEMSLTKDDSERKA